MPRQGALLSDPASLPAWITDSDIDVYVEAFTRAGFTVRSPGGATLIAAGSSWPPFDGTAVSVPALYIVGDRDFVATAFEQAIAKQSSFVPKLRPPVMLAACGHWTQQERAAEVSTAMIDFLRSM